MNGQAGMNNRDNNLGYFSRDAAIRRPGSTALIDLCGAEPREITYGELEERLDRFASLITSLGLKPGDRMAIAVGNRFEFIEVMYGAMRAGVVAVPLNVKLGVDMLAFIIADAGCKAAVAEPGCNPHFVGLVEAARLPVKLAFHPVPAGWRDYEAALQAASPRFDPPALADDHPAFQPYTSGSTGRPKGVVLTHAGQYWWIRACQKYWPIVPEDRALVAVPLYHKNAMAGGVKVQLHAGASTVILPNFGPRRFLEVLSKYGCTHASGVPAVFTLLLQEKDLIERLDFSTLKVLRIGSAPTPKELQDAVEAAFGVPVRESYGLTEGGPVMIGPPLDGRAVPHGSCGVAWPEGEIKLVGPDGQEGAAYGELWVRNPGVTPGYYNLPKVNQERIVDGWLKTGDLFRRDEQGFLYFRGRVDDMFNSGGENVYPLEVENLLLGHPDVVDVSVIPFPHAIKGEVPVAMVVRARGAKATEEDLKKFCLAHGPAYAHPRRIIFVDALPLSGAAKIDRNLVQQMVRNVLGDSPLGAREG